MEIEDLSADADCLADDIRRRTHNHTVTRFSFAFPADNLSAVARALMKCGLRCVRVEQAGTVLMLEVPLHRLDAAVATCLAYDGKYLRMVALPS
jgi:hypothetical protein